MNKKNWYTISPRFTTILPLVTASAQYIVELRGREPTYTNDTPYMYMPLFAQLLDNTERRHFWKMH